MPLAWNKWQDFFTSVLLTLCVPLLPLALEWFLSSNVSSRSLVLAAAMYVLAKGLISKHKIIFTCSVIAGLILAFLSGLCHVEHYQLPDGVRGFAMSCIALTFILHLSERFEVHMVHGEPFFKF